MRAGMYESFYLRAVSPDEPAGVWIRYTVHKRRGQRPKGSVWCTVFDARRGSPFMHKVTSEALSVPAGGWIEVDGARMTPARAEGTCGPARWSLQYASDEPELRHLPWGWLYRTPLPRTKLTSPAPAASFDGVLELSGRGAIELRGWRGVVGHNWGSEHAERWIWLHGIGFREQPRAWLDIALGRLRVAGRMTPWAANGVLSLDGRRYRVGGFLARGLAVAETPDGCVVSLPGERGLALTAAAAVPHGSAAGWRYADPDDESADLNGTAGASSEHDVINCSVAALDLTVRLPGEGGPRTLHSSHGGAYELGLRERDHGVPLAPFADG